MTGEDLRRVLEQLAWSQKHLGDLLGANERVVRFWLSGKEGVPPVVAEWLWEVEGRRRAHPDPDPPLRWRKRERSADARALVLRHRQARRVKRRELRELLVDKLWSEGGPVTRLEALKANAKLTARQLHLEERAAERRAKLAIDPRGSEGGEVVGVDLGEHFAPQEAQEDATAVVGAEGHDAPPGG